MQNRKGDRDDDKKPPNVYFMSAPILQPQTTHDYHYVGDFI